VLRFLLKTTLTLLLGSVLVILSPGIPAAYLHEAKPGNYIEQVTVDGWLREFRLHVPKGYNGARALPIVVVFHGSSASASVIERETSMNTRADAFGFFVVYPEGLHRAWNIGECCRYSFLHHVSETAFLTGILDQMHSSFMVDPSRVYVTGYSDGATLSFLLGCALPNRIAAVAGVSGTLFEPEPRCPLPKPIPAMIIHGTGDTQIPYGGDRGGPPQSKGDHFTHSAPDVARFWVTHDGCATPPDSARVEQVVRLGYHCPDSAEVVFYTILGGHHGWPGGGRGWVFSPEPPKDMIASDSIVQFFLRHQLRPSVHR